MPAPLTARGHGDESDGRVKARRERQRSAAKRTGAQTAAVRLRPDLVPEEVRPLLRLAEQWDIGDDFDREAAVLSTTPAELKRLVTAIDQAPDGLWDWLGGPASFDGPLTREYLALTHLTMAADSARLELRHR